MRPDEINASQSFSDVRRQAADLIDESVSVLHRREDDSTVDRQCFEQFSCTDRANAGSIAAMAHRSPTGRYRPRRRHRCHDEVQVEPPTLAQHFFKSFIEEPTGPTVDKVARMIHIESPDVGGSIRQRST